MYYSPEIIIDTGASIEDIADEDHLGILLSIPITITNFIGSIFAIFIIDKLGRRYLMLRAIPGVTLTLVLISVWFFFCVFGGDEDTKHIARIWVFLLLIIYRSLFGNGMSWSVWAINTEIYPIHLADTAMAISTAVSWLSSFVVASWFLSGLETDAGKVYSFDILAVFGTIAFIYVYYFIHETAGRSIEYNVKRLTTGLDPDDEPKEKLDEQNPLMGGLPEVGDD
jgi:MFS family permease